MSDTPYTDTEDKEGKIRRLLACVEPEDLVWHRDEEDRTITVIEGQGWQLQYNGWIPILLEEGKQYHIPKQLYHRLIVGATDLKIRLTY